MHADVFFFFFAFIKAGPEIMCARHKTEKKPVVAEVFCHGCVPNFTMYDAETYSDLFLLHADSPAARAGLFAGLAIVKVPILLADKQLSG